MEKKNSTPLNTPRYITAVIEIIQHFYSSVTALMVIAGYETRKLRSYLNIILVVLISNCYSWLFIAAANGNTKRGEYSSIQF